MNQIETAIMNVIKAELKRKDIGVNILESQDHSHRIELFSNRNKTTALLNLGPIVSNISDLIGRINRKMKV